MKARMAMILSVTGVLAAGTAAALVNTEVLREDGGAPVTTPVSTTGPEATPAPSTVAPTELATSTATSASTTSTPASGTVTQVSTPSTPLVLPPATLPTAPSSSAQSATGSATQQQFRLGDAATAVLDTANGQLTIVSVVPHPGWVVDRAEQDDATTVEIRMRSANGEVRFDASLVRGVVTVSLETDDDNEADVDGDGDNSGSGSGSSGSGSSGSGSTGSGSGDD